MAFELPLNRVVQQVPPSGIRKFFDVVSEMEGAISLGVGEPDFVTPWPIRWAAMQSIQNGDTHYTSNWGDLSLRTLIARYLERYHLSYDPHDQILVTVGASEAIDIVLRAAVNPGEEVLIPDPSYVSYAPGVTFAGAVPVAVPTYADNGFRLTPEALAPHITEKTRALILPYPNNPTGGIMERGDLEQLAALLRQHNILVISDEIYSELTYKGKHVSIASLPDMAERTVVINGFSKAFAMTGWRLGYIAGPRPLIHAAFKIHQYTMLCAPIMSQKAAEAALTIGLSDGFAQVKEMVAEYNKRRKYLAGAFNQIGMRCFEPLGAFYVFPSVAGCGMDSETFCESLLMEQKVAVVPGTAFGDNGEGFVRCSYAYSMEALKRAVDRIGRFVAAHRA